MKVGQPSALAAEERPALPGWIFWALKVGFVVFVDCVLVPRGVGVGMIHSFRRAWRLRRAVPALL